VSAVLRLVGVEIAKVRSTRMWIGLLLGAVGLAALGAPILDYRGEVRGAISVSGLCDDILGERRRFLTERLLAAAHETSLALGHGAHSAGNGR